MWGWSNTFLSGAQSQNHPLMPIRLELNFQTTPDAGQSDAPAIVLCTVMNVRTECTTSDLHLSFDLCVPTLPSIYPRSPQSQGQLAIFREHLRRRICEERIIFMQLDQGTMKRNEKANVYVYCKLDKPCKASPGPKSFWKTFQKSMKSGCLSSGN